MEYESGPRGHAIVCGFGHLGCRIAQLLQDRGCEVVVIDKQLDASLRNEAEESSYRLIEGDIRDENVLEQAGIDSARSVIIVTGDDRANLEAAITARTRNQGTSIVLCLFDQSMARRIETLIDVHALSASFLASPAYVSAATDDSMVAMLNVDGHYLNIHHVCRSGKTHQGVYVYKNDASLCIESCEDEIPSKDECLFVSAEDLSHSMHTGSRRKHRRVKTFSDKFRNLLPLLNPIRLAREIADIWEHAASVTRSIFIAVTAIAILSVFMFSYAGNMNTLDALYFVVTTMTTVGYGDFNLQHANPALKLYGIIMMLSGAALLTTVYALITDHVLTARVEHLLGRREIDMRDHTVVVGLGNIGFRVASDLKMLGVDVVAVEVREDSENVNAARALFPVMIGDAARMSILQKAGIDRAEVVLAVTDDPMLNLGVALHARESNPDVKTVVRTYDIVLADKFRCFGLDHVLSTSAIAAPAFVDAALYPGVQGSFYFGGEDILVARHVIDERSSLYGKSPRGVSDQIGIAVVLQSDSTSQQYKPANPDKPLPPGTRVVVLLTRTNFGSLT